MKHKVHDAIMGLCIADALGVPVEFTDRESLKANPVVGMRGYGTYNQPPGTWSDDTSLTLCLLDSLATGLDYKDIMEKFKAWYTQGEYTPHGKVFDIGNATRQAIQRFIQGAEPLDCGGRDDRDNGNGSLMRILPLVFYLRALYGRNFQESEEAFKIIHDVSALTHAHKRSQIACGIYLSIAGMLGDGFGIQGSVEEGIRRAFVFYNRPGWEEELSAFSRLMDPQFKNTPEEQIRSGGYVVHTLEAAVWCLLNTESYKECVLKAVNLGGDTDTTAAVAGGLAGLFYGSEAIPKAWLEGIIRRDYIEELCSRLEASMDEAVLDRLLGFIPYFEKIKPGEVGWTTGWEDGTFMLSDNYDEPIMEFVDLFHDSKLIHYEYRRVLDEHGLSSSVAITAAIADADLELVRAILTWAIRAEHFCGGAWAEAAEDGTFLRLLCRIRELRRKIY